MSDVQAVHPVPARVLSRGLVGLQAGLLAGAAVVVIFFVLDLVHLAPLATPRVLATRIWGPGSVSVDLPVLSQAIAVGGFTGTLLVFTLLHFLAFSLLGVVAVVACDETNVPVNWATGAAYGLIVCTVVFYWFVTLGGGSVLQDLPGPLAIAGGNLVAGGIMGGYVQMVCGSRPAKEEVG
jgi:hypothetical protein